MTSSAQQVFDETATNPRMALAQKAVSLGLMAAVVGVLGYVLAGFGGAAVGLIGAAAYAQYAWRKARRELGLGPDEQRVLRVEWEAPASRAGVATQPAVVQRWVGPRPSSAASDSRWFVAGRDPRQVAFELAGRRPSARR